jgi:hypothetical protein
MIMTHAKLNPVIERTTTALGLTQSLTEMSTRNLPGGKGWLSCKADNLTTIVSRLSRKCGSLDISQSYGTPQPLTGIALRIMRTKR